MVGCWGRSNASDHSVHHMNPDGSYIAAQAGTGNSRRAHRSDLLRCLWKCSCAGNELMGSQELTRGNGPALFFCRMDATCKPLCYVCCVYVCNAKHSGTGGTSSKLLAA